ncbi:MAG: hypothetical protein H8D56_01695, partial [Planctomycetes bacterium]|nr:hypothetical protein [Planctomycetota bacterium]
MQALQAHSERAGAGVPIGQQGASLVPEVADIYRAEGIIGMEVCRADDVVFVGGVAGEGFDFQAGFGQVGEVAEEDLRALGADAMGVEGFVCFAFGEEIYFVAGCSLNEGLSAFAQERRVAAAVRAGPLAGRGVGAAGGVGPGGEGQGGRGCFRGGGVSVGGGGGGRGFWRGGVEGEGLCSGGGP